MRKLIESYKEACQLLARSENPLISARGVKALSDPPSNRQWQYNRAVQLALESDEYSDEEKATLIAHLDSLKYGVRPNAMLGFRNGKFYAVNIHPFVVATVGFDPDDEGADFTYWSEKHNISLTPESAVSPLQWADMRDFLAEMVAEQLQRLEEELD